MAQNTGLIALRTIHYKDELDSKRDPLRTLHKGNTVPAGVLNDAEVQRYLKEGIVGYADGRAPSFAGSVLLEGERGPATGDEGDGFGDNPSTVQDEKALGELDQDRNGQVDKKDAAATKAPAKAVTKTVSKPVARKR